MSKFKQPKTIEETFLEMKRLSKSFDEKNEVIKESTEVIPDETVLKAEADRLKEIARLNEWGMAGLSSASQYSANVPTVQGFGQTVNTFLDPQQNLGARNGNNEKKYNPNYTFLQPAEALNLALTRTLESGAPVNNLGFYDEVNWNLNNMGFLSKQPLDIKNAILKMIKGTPEA